LGNIKYIMGSLGNIKYIMGSLGNIKYIMGSLGKKIHNGILGKYKTTSKYHNLVLRKINYTELP